jgi:hypothetical protein
MSTFDSHVSKREIVEAQIEHTRLSFLDRQSSNQNLSSRGIIVSNHRNRMLISLHDNGEDGKHAHGFADFYITMHTIELCVLIFVFSYILCYIFTHIRFDSKITRFYCFLLR